MKKNMSVIFAVATMVALISLSASRAEMVYKTADLQNSKKIVAYAYSRPMIEIMFRHGMEQDKKFGLQLNCKSRYKATPSGMSVLSPIDFPDGRKHPVKGIWKTQYKLERCGESKIYNSIFKAENNGKEPASAIYYPGSTNADPLLIKDAMMPAVTTALSKHGLKDCKSVDVFDMRITGQARNVIEGNMTFRGVWDELWTFKMCGQMIDVGITFIPDPTGNGTTFRIESQKGGKEKTKP